MSLNKITIMNNILLLTEEERLLIDSVQKFAKQELLPLANIIDQTDKFPTELWKKLGSQGFLGVTVAEEFGGAGLGYFEHVLIMQEISKESASVGLSYAAHSNLCINQLYLHGNKEQKNKYLPKLVAGEYVGALAMTEPNAGSDIMSMQMRAVEKSDHYILNGTKMWITNGPSADVILVYAITSNTEHKKHLSCFIVENNFPGFSVGQKIDKLGMRGSETAELIFENCIVPKENLLGTKDAGSKILMSGLDYERIILAAGPTGIMAKCLELVIPYLSERKQFGKTIGSFQLMQGKLADMFCAYSASTSYLYNIAKACAIHPPRRQDAAAIILFAAEQATKLALETIQCFGGNGYSNEYCAGRLLRDAKLYEIGAGTSEIRRMLIGREVLKTGNI